MPFNLFLFISSIIRLFVSFQGPLAVLGLVRSLLISYFRSVLTYSYTERSDYFLQPCKNTRLILGDFRPAAADICMQCGGGCRNHSPQPSSRRILDFAAVRRGIFWEGKYDFLHLDKMDIPSLTLFLELTFPSFLSLCMKIPITPLPAIDTRIPVYLGFNNGDGTLNTNPPPNLPRHPNNRLCHRISLHKQYSRLPPPLRSQ